MHHLNEHLQWRKRRKPEAPLLKAASGVFCMSGPVMPADDEDEVYSENSFGARDALGNGERGINGKTDLEGKVSVLDDTTDRALDKKLSNEHVAVENGESVVDGEDKVTVPDGITAKELERKLPNGDVYLGNLLERRGKYIWADGCIYEGQWERGKQNGKGKLVWPSGAVYVGDFSDGYMHGIGTYIGVNGNTYKGNWSMNIKHGLGRMKYINGDKYEGTWKDGVQDGFGKYVWANKNVYVGDWKGGVMSGKGVLRWAMGDAFNGEWLNGLEHGRGVYYWVDGSIFVGTWSRGLKDGKGVFYPAGTLPSDIRARENLMLHKVDEYLATGIAKDWSSIQALRNHRRDPNPKSIISSGSGNLDQQLRKNVWLGRRWSLEGPLERVLGLDSLTTSLTREAILEGETLPSLLDVVPPILEREYAQGVLINEIVKHPIGGGLSKSARKRQRRQAKEPKKPGETIFKGHRSYDLMLSLQLGIRYTVGKTTPEPKHNIGPLDFGSKASVRMKFPKLGSQVTPCHKTVDFAWKDYCPKVFRRLREMFKIDAADYMLSLCGNSALRELSSPGKSGSVFFLSHDDRFMIKTMRKSEVKVLLRMLRSYYNHVCMYENTLITKFFGLHRVKPQGGQKVRFVVMGNMFCTDVLHIHRRYDLKGSLQGRCTEKADMDENTTLKDLDLDFVFHLEPSWRDALMKQIACDCKFLESQHIMDYSLLLGLHFRAPQYPKVPGSGGAMESIPDCDEEWTPARSLVLVPRDQGQQTVSSVGLHVRGGPLKAAGAGDGEVDLLLPGTARLQIQLGVNMPARADKKKPDNEESVEGEQLEEAYDVVLYVGLIDILQEYDMSKKLEHAYKSLQFEPSSISAIEPKAYSKRFQDFICKIFPENNRNGGA